MKFTTLITYTQQGIQNIAESPARAAAFSKQAANEFGVEITERLWLTGQYDGLLVYTAPDVETAAAAMLTLSKAGNVKTVTMPAFDADGMSRVLGKN